MSASSASALVSRSASALASRSASALGDATSADTVGTSVLLVPVGSVEQHGPHLPLSTDSVIAGAVCARVAAALGASGHRVSLAPCVEYGASGEHEGFAGTVSIGSSALELLLVELVRSATRWVDRVVAVSGHGGNVAALTACAELMAYEGRDFAWTTCAQADWDAHAGLAETSVMLTVAPNLVRMADAEVGNTEPVRLLLPLMRSGGVAAVAPNGVLGDPRDASAERGRELLTAVEERVVAQILARRREASGALVRPDRSGVPS